MSAAPAVVSREEWLRARLDLLQKEKELTRFRDDVAARRRTLPWVKVDKSYRFDTEQGQKSLADLFAGRSQMIVYHFMYGPEWESPCPSCCFIGDHFDGVIPHLNARDVTLTVTRTGLNRVRIASDYPRLPVVEVTLQRALDKIVQSRGDTVFVFDSKQKPPKLDVSFLGEVSWSGSKQ